MVKVDHHRSAAFRGAHPALIGARSALVAARRWRGVSVRAQGSGKWSSTRMLSTCSPGAPDAPRTLRSNRGAAPEFDVHRRCDLVEVAKGEGPRLFRPAIRRRLATDAARLCELDLRGFPE